MIEKGNQEISVQRQCALLGQARSGYYYSPVGVSEKDLLLMRLLDEQYTRCPFYGSRRLRDWLGDQGHWVGRDHVRRLMRLMGIEAIYPKRRTSIPNREHRVYPYLLGGLNIVRPNQVWAVDITYIRLLRGFCYLVAIMDWFSRYVISWEVSVSLEVDFCLDALDEALSLGRPEIFNSDQGSQFTSEAFTTRLKEAGIRISMDGKGRVFDNILIERLWRSVKYEEVYLKDYEDVLVARDSLGKYFPFYNELRRHQGLKGFTPEEVYKGLAKIGVAG